MQEDTGEQLPDPQEETADQVAQRLRDAQTIIIGVLQLYHPCAVQQSVVCDF